MDQKNKRNLVTEESLSNKKARVKKKKQRKQHKKVDPKDTNRYQHWEIRAAFLGAMIKYSPRVGEELGVLINQGHTKKAAIQIWFESVKSIGMDILDFSPPRLSQN